MVDLPPFEIMLIILIFMLSSLPVVGFPSIVASIVSIFVAPVSVIAEVSVRSISLVTIVAPSFVVESDITREVLAHLLEMGVLRVASIVAFSYVV